jgi:hypothetical protein
MSPRSLFSIIIKVIGIFLLKDILLFFPSLFVQTDSMISGEYWISLGYISTVLLTMLLYILLAYATLFKTAWIIDKLKLDHDFPEEMLATNTPPSTVLKISITVIGGLMLINALPVLITQLILYWSYINHTDVYIYPDSRSLIIPLIKLIIGILMIIYARLITNFIELRRRK